MWLTYVGAPDEAGVGEGLFHPEFVGDAQFVHVAVSLLPLVREAAYGSHRRARLLRDFIGSSQ